MRPLFYLLLLGLIGCVPPQDPSPLRPLHGHRLDGYGPVRFGMEYAEARDTLIRAGKNPSIMPDGSLSYYDQWMNHSFLVVQHFTKAGTADNAELWLVGGERIHSQAQCEQSFNSFKSVLDAQYGRPDSHVPKEKIAEGCNVTARYSFGDSSFIELFYTFNPGPTNAREQHGCTIRLSYMPIWARLCLITSNRFCDFVGNSVPMIDGGE